MRIVDMNKSEKFPIWIGIVLLVYVSSYLILSRRAFRNADRDNIEGFYFIVPTTPAMFSIHRGLVYLYYPLIMIDTALGTGRAPANAPHFDLSFRVTGKVAPRLS